MSMTSNNFERMKIILSMNQSFDYADFLRICESKGAHPLSINEYALKVGFIEMAKIKYPDVPIEEGYLKIVEDGNMTCGNKEDKPLPSTGQQAINLVSGVAHHIADGLKEVDEKTLEFRNNICDACENMRSDGRCSECGCSMKIKAKWASAKCPAGKW